MLTANEIEVLMSGAAGTGKSLACLRKLHLAARDYPNARCLMVRKTRVSLTNAALVTFEQHVLGLGHPMTQGAGRANRTVYHYPNGSEISIGGMDNPTRIMSTEWDMIYVQEAIELDSVDLESLKTRLRNGKTPIQQLIMDTNPSFPLHWLKRRCDAGLTRLIYCHHEDNPILYDHGTNQWTARGQTYLRSLDQLTGIMKERLRYGRWVQAEGVVYDNFDPEQNVSISAEYDPSQEVYYGVDDGYVQGGGPGTESYHPRVVLFGQQTAQGGLNIFYEYYRTGVTSYDQTIDEIFALPYPPAEVAYVDSSAAMFKGALWNRGVNTIGATHKVQEGIKNLRRLICDGNNMRLLHIHPRCTNLIRELQSYRYAENSFATGGEPRTIKLDDHGPDSLRYLAWKLRFE